MTQFGIGASSGVQNTLAGLNFRSAIGFTSDASIPTTLLELAATENTALQAPLSAFNLTGDQYQINTIHNTATLGGNYTPSYCVLIRMDDDDNDVEIVVGSSFTQIIAPDSSLVTAHTIAFTYTS